MLLFMILTACTATEKDPESDRDNDGYSDIEEENAGTNPDIPESHPLEFGNYNLGDCPNGLPSSQPPAEEGYIDDGGGISWNHYRVGDTIQNLTLRDQYNQEIDLYQFCGQHIMLITSSFT